MSSLIPGYEYDIFISYRQKDNKYDGWVTSFVDNLKKELEATFKEDLSIYFDENPHDGLLETHNVNKSLENKLKCLVFIPVISQTYCDPKSFAWQNEFCAFNKLSKEDQFGRDIRVGGGNVTSRILPVKINDLDPDDKSLLENELGGVLRSVDFIYKSAGVNRPLRANEDHPQDNLNKTYYRDQINKVANSVKEIIKGIKDPNADSAAEKIKVPRAESGRRQLPWKKFAVSAVIITLLLIAGWLVIPYVIKISSRDSSEVGKSIAVLPFTNLSTDPGQEYFSEGLVDDIITNLSKIGDLDVRSRTSSARFKNSSQSLKEIAGELGVSAILEGSVRRSVNSVRITVQLINAKTDSHVWSETYDRDISELFSIQSEVAQTVARELKAVVTPEARQLIMKRPTLNIAAYEAYLKGRYHWNLLNEKDTQTAMEYFEQAKEIDPDFALAYAGIAWVWVGWRQMGAVRPDEATPMVDKALNKALELDKDNADVQYILAGELAWGKWDWNGGENAYRRAIELNPNHAEAHAFYSHLLFITNRRVAGMYHIETALKLDPLNPLVNLLYSVALVLQRRYEDAIKAYERALELNPSLQAGNVITALYFSGREDEAMEYWRKQMTNQDNLKIIDEGYKEGGFKGANKKWADFRVERSKVRFQRSILTLIAYLYAGDIDNALYWLEKTYEERDPNLPYILSPEYDVIREEPRFREIARKMNLPYK